MGSYQTNPNNILSMRALGSDRLTGIVYLRALLELHVQHIPRHCSGFPWISRPGSTGKLKPVVHGREFEIAETH